MKTYKQLKKELLKNKKIKKAYQEMSSEFELIEKIIERRIEQKLTQKELAAKIGTKQSAISRLESGSCNPSLSFLKKIANVLNGRLKIEIK